MASKQTQPIGIELAKRRLITEADINNLIQLAQYAGATADTLAMLNSVKSTYATNLARSGGSETYAAHYASKQLAYEQKYG